MTTQLHENSDRREYLLTALRGDQQALDRIERLYLPIYEWCLKRIEEKKGLIIGLNGPQGAGKTTLTRLLCELLHWEGFQAVSLSIDDFYLTRREQIELAKNYPDNPYLQERGYPGTHDLELGVTTLRALKGAKGEVLLPTYEKSLHQGKGDRLAQSDWRKIELPVDCIFFEGWMLGFKSVRSHLISDRHLSQINDCLEAYQSWTGLLDAWIALEPKDYHFVIDWRVEAEQKMRSQGKPGLNDDEIRAYIKTFLPAYELYLPELSKNPPLSGPRKIIEIGQDRMPLRTLNNLEPSKG